MSIPAGTVTATEIYASRLAMILLRSTETSHASRGCFLMVPMTAMLYSDQAAVRLVVARVRDAADRIAVLAGEVIAPSSLTRCGDARAASRAGDASATERAGDTSAASRTKGVSTKPPVE